MQIKKAFAATATAVIVYSVLGLWPYLQAQGIILSAQRIVIGLDERTIASNGGGTAATLTLIPLTNAVAITCNDPDTCAITMGETGFPGATINALVASTRVVIVNVGTNIITFADSAGVQEVRSSASLDQYEAIEFVYMTDRWVEVSRST